MKVIGIDPGIATTGYAVVEGRPGRLRALAFGVVRTPTTEPLAVRLAALGGRLEAIVATHGPQVAAVERLFFNSNARTAMAVGQASGVALAVAARVGVEVATYTPTEVKGSIVGVGSASKQQVQAMVARVLRLPAPARPADASDACALAICHLNRLPLARALEGAGA
jgi:crossover junction endodeoxyribonuclease RuvC